MNFKDKKKEKTQIDRQKKERPAKPPRPVKNDRPAKPPRPEKPVRDAEPAQLPDDILIGRNAVTEALKNTMRVNRLLIAEGAQTKNGDGSIPEIIALAKEKKVKFETVPRETIEGIACGHRHQGVLAYVAPVEYADLDKVIDEAAAKENPLLILLDGIEDPHNLGAILRTADAVGADGVLLPRHHSVPLNATVAKTSAGAIEYVPVARIGNIAQTLKELKDKGFWVYGADMDGACDYDKANFTGPVVLIIGSEGHGIARLTRENCDTIVSLPMVGRINSLNASVAGAILMYEVSRQRRNSSK